MTSATDSSSTTTIDPTDADTSSGGDDTTWIALIRGEMADPDPEASRIVHDMIAGGAMGPAMAAGDFGHDALLQTTLLGGTENDFLALDRWSSLEGAQATYSDPAFLRAFGSFFAAPPSLELFEHRDDWAEYGDFDIADDDDDHYFVVVRGRLIEGDAQSVHDGIVAGAQKAANAAGDVAHLVYTGVDDEREFFALDIWNETDNLAAFYGDPQLQQALAMLFAEPPTVQVYRSTDWLQW